MTTASLIVHGVPVYPRHGRPPVEAIGIVDGLIRGAGTLAEVRAALPPGADELLLENGAVLPAFVDAHQHAFLDAVDPYTDALLGVATDLRGLMKRVPEIAARDRPVTPGPGTADPGSLPWLRLHGYLPTELREQRSPTAAELDEVVSDRPLHVLSRTYHESVVNSAGLDVLGIGPRTPDPVGGAIARDRKGKPTGVLLEAASFEAEGRSRPPFDPTVWQPRLAAHARRLLSYGITRIADAAVPQDLAASFVDTLDRHGIHAHALLVGATISAPAFEAGGTAKVLVDGGERCHLCYTPRQYLAGALAALSAPLRARSRSDVALAVGIMRRSPLRREGDGNWHSGTRSYDPDTLHALMRRAADAGSGLAFHAIGNGAVQTVLAARDRDAGVSAAVPIRVEHAMVVDPELTCRLADAGIPVVAQPGLLPAMGRSLTVIPPARPLLLMPYRDLLEAGVPLAFSSDHPATDLNPWQWVSAAVTRKDDRGRAVRPEQALTPAQALDASTRAAAAVLGDHDAGTLEPGLRADFVHVDADPYHVRDEALDAIGTLGTWRDGRRVYQREA